MKYNYIDSSNENGINFIDEPLINSLINENIEEDSILCREIFAKSRQKQPLNLQDTAALISIKSPELLNELFETARELKRDIYGKRIVLFAPLYVGNYCVNDCTYCGFRRSARGTIRKTLTKEELVTQINILKKSKHMKSPYSQRGKTRKKRK